jgi:hypothetical protein
MSNEQFVSSVLNKGDSNPDVAGYVRSDRPLPGPGPPGVRPLFRRFLVRSYIPQTAGYSGKTARDS